MKPANLEFHIEELVLDGVGDAEIGPAVERELGRLFTESGVPPSLARGGSAALVEGGAFVSPAEEGAAGFGDRIASAVYRSLKR